MKKGKEFKPVLSKPSLIKELPERLEFDGPIITPIDPCQYPGQTGCGSGGNPGGGIRVGWN